MDGLENLCRVCLTSGNVDIDYLLINIFEIQNHGTTSSEFSIRDSLQIICGLKLSEDDPLPKNICSVCLSRLEEAHKLRQLSQTSQQTLYDMLANAVTSSAEASDTKYATIIANSVGKSHGKSLGEPQSFAITSAEPTEQENATATEHDEDMLYEVEYLDEPEPSEIMELAEDDIKIEEVEIGEQTTDEVHCCGCEAAFDSELQLRKHSIRRHRPRSVMDVPRGRAQCNVCYTLFSNEFKVKIHKMGKNNVQPLKKCAFCGCNFFSEKGLLNHEKQFHKDKLHKCCKCSFSCYEKDELLAHSTCHYASPNTKKNRKAHQCKLCMSQFVTLQEKQLHERLPYKIPRKQRPEKDEEVTVTVLRCCGCAKVFSTMSELTTHQEQAHLPNRLDYTEDNPVECAGCYKRFKSNSFLNKHLRRAADKKLYACSKCTVTRRTLKELIEHESSHTGENAFLCCGCKKRFESNELLEQHALQEHANRPKMYYNDEDDIVRPFQCKICYRRYKTARDLRGHQRFVYYDKVHTCQICGKGFSQENSLALHIATHKTKAEFPCPICGKKYKHRANVRNCVIRHERPKQHKCKICNVTFPAASNLYSHMISHSEDRRYKCDVCGQSFKRSFHLRKHMNTHTTEKHYACKYCSSKFCTTSELYKHEIRHTGVYPYECEICDKKLTTRQVFIKHYESHIEVSKKVFVCNLCPEKFSLDHFLSNHIKYKHRIEPQDKQWNEKFNRKGPARLRGGLRFTGVRGNAYAYTAPQDVEASGAADEEEHLELMEDFGEEVEIKVDQ
ncbi:zinc finger protein 665 [Aedes albopictus]|uniref:C2h2-type zn-finger protein n=1 Tax=Aedes albopictus TaxID=7160 RepID=A0ABM2A5Q4_AEDAL|nr:zinc finger protein 665-like [Aedes albopictus]